MKTAAPEPVHLLFDEQETSLQESHTYWFKKRILFNILVGIAGLVPMATHVFSLSLFDIFGVAMWAFVANAFFSYGYVLESFIVSRSKGKKNMRELRDLLFWLGTLAYMAVSLAFGFEYFGFK